MLAEALCDHLFADGGELQQDQHPSDAEDFFGILAPWQDCVSGGDGQKAVLPSDAATPPKSAANGDKINNKRPRQGGCDGRGDVYDDDGALQEPAKRQRCSPPAVAGKKVAAKKTTTTSSHIAVERSRRKQMNEHIAVLRLLMPCFYVKRGDQASIIGCVVDYIKELQLLETKKQRKAYTDQLVLSPRPPQPPARGSPRPLLPIKSTPPMSPRPAVPMSPRRPPMPSSPYKLCNGQPSLPLSLPLPPPRSFAYASPVTTPTTSQGYLPSLDAIAAELCAYTTASKQPGGGGTVLPAEVKVEFSGANLVVKTVSQRAPGQAVKVIAALEGRSLEILHAKINTVDGTAVNSFTVKVSIRHLVSGLCTSAPSFIDH